MSAHQRLGPSTWKEGAEEEEEEGEGQEEEEDAGPEEGPAVEPAAPCGACS